MNNPLFLIKEWVERTRGDSSSRAARLWQHRISLEKKNPLVAVKKKKKISCDLASFKIRAICHRLRRRCRRRPRPRCRCCCRCRHHHRRRCCCRRRRHRCRRCRRCRRHLRQRTNFFLRQVKNF